MSGSRSKARGVGLERLCTESPADWIRSTEAEDGIECLEAWFQGPAYHKHRHDTYAICLTTIGVQAFCYRGAAEISVPGQVVVLHPDELHDGHAATDEGFGYRILYVEPALISEALKALCSHPCPLPFVRTPVATNPKLSAAITNAFQNAGQPLALDSVLLQLAEGLMDADPYCRRASMPPRCDVAALERARRFLDENKMRKVRSEELESVTGLTRYELARQFRTMFGTSPHRYLLMRRLDRARRLMSRCRSLVDVSLEAGFADQSHFTRMFKAAFGLTPARYRALGMNAGGNGAVSRSGKRLREPAD
jgi:AraC-like DNA-binding protein